MKKDVKADVRCKHCSRFITSLSKQFNDTLKCPNSSCKKMDTYKIVFMSDLFAKSEKPRTV